MIVPRLQRFYGGDPARWFDLHPALLDAFATMRERLIAEEAIHTVDVTLASSEHLKPDERQGILDHWHRVARGHDPQGVAQGERDARGRDILRSGQAVRDWLVRTGGFRREQVAE